MALVGATDVPSSNEAMIFSGIYALFSGLVYIFIIAFFASKLLNSGN